jgi:hypothetical protein
MKSELNEKVNQNEYEFRIFGMRRSGNHMVIGSIISCFDDGQVFFLNDVLTPKNLLQYQRRGTCRCGIGRTDTNYMGALASKLVPKEFYNPGPFYQEFRKCLIQSYEDADLNIITDVNEQKIGLSQMRYNILIIRDPYNWIASRLQLKFTKLSCLIVDTDIVNMWKQHAREYLGDTNILGNNKVCINYNRFISDEEYQKQICSTINLPHEKMNFNHTLNFGHGSSFSGLKKDDNEKYTQRWTFFDQNKLYQSLTDDPELKELAERIFGSKKQ